MALNDKNTEPAANSKLLDRTCPQCGEKSSNLLPKYSNPPWRIAECSVCRFVYLKNPPGYGRLVHEFAWEKTRAAEVKRRKRHSPIRVRIDHATRWRARLFDTKTGTLLQRIFWQGRVLDIGCGAGKKVPEPFTPFGIEISEELCKTADATMRRRGGYAIHAPAIDGIKQFDDSYFTGIVLRSFLEHEVNPKELLFECARVLASGGAVYVRVPNFGSVNRRLLGFKWCGFRYPDHVNYFTVKSLSSMAQDCGFELKLINPLRLPLDDNINGVLRPIS